MEQNGHLKEMIEAQGARILTLEEVLRDGLKDVADKIESQTNVLIQAVAAKDHIPTSVVLVLIRTLCWLFGLVIAWITGLKYLAPQMFP